MKKIKDFENRDPTYVSSIDSGQSEIWVSSSKYIVELPSLKCTAVQYRPMRLFGDYTIVALYLKGILIDFSIFLCLRIMFEHT